MSPLNTVKTDRDTILDWALWWSAETRSDEVIAQPGRAASLSLLHRFKPICLLPTTDLACSELGSPYLTV